MPETRLPAPISVEMVRSALAHLYDYAFLQTHPLAAMLDGAQDLDHLTRAQTLRRALLDALESLRPHAPEAPDAAGLRAYTILTYRYVDGMTVEQIMAKLVLSRRQVYREHAKGLEAVTSLLAAGQGELAARRGEDPAPASAPSDRLTLARAEVERLRQTARPQSVEVGEVLQAVCALLAPRLQQTGVSIAPALASAPHMPAANVVADRTLLRQALFNLLSYALDAVAGRGDLHIVLESSPQEVTIRIQEVPTARRSPLPAETLPAETREGVGLAVAREMVEALGGELHLDDQALPWQAHMHLPTANPPTLLVIDDNADLVTLIQRYLGGHQISVMGASGGSQVLELARRLRPQLILLDLMMPGQDGWEVLAALKGDPELSAIPVIICSVLKEADLARALGAGDYLSKPVNQSQLLDVLRRWLGRLYPLV